MKRTFLYTCCTLFLMLIFVLGCSDRGVNYDTDPASLQQGGPLADEGAHVIYPNFAFQISNKFSQVDFGGYSPKAFFDNDTIPYPPLPLLILLPPQDGDANYYATHGLIEIADELITKGEMQPMHIVTMQNDQVFGGYFYSGTSPAGGNYDAFMGQELLDFIREKFAPNYFDSQQKIGIGGIGMGGYAAFRTAIRNPGMFGSISAVAGPLDFDGADGNSGLISMFDDALIEQGLLNQGMYDTVNARSAFRSLGQYHLSRLFIGGTFAFAPYDTAIYFDTLHNSSGSISYDIDSVNSFPVAIDVNDPNNRVLNLSIATLPNSPRLNPTGFDSKLRFILPFTSAGTIDAGPTTPGVTVWDRWIANNLETLLAASPNALDGVDMMIANSVDAQFANYYAQTESWINTLEGAPYNRSITKTYYQGYDGFPAQFNQYAFDLIKEMLIFHSESFGN